MVEALITDIKEVRQAEIVLAHLQKEFVGLKINFDLQETDFSFPCGHTILRAEGTVVDAAELIGLVRGHGFQCQILEDKVCTKQLAVNE